jgi:hypothetical protein
MGELYSSTTNPIVQQIERRKSERKDASNYTKSKLKVQIIAYLKFTVYFKCDTCNF